MDKISPDISLPNKHPWDSLRISLMRFFEGPPIGKKGVFHGVVMTVFKFISGEALLTKGDTSVVARKGEWMVCHPGERYQNFSDSAVIISIHLKIECPGSNADWTGPTVVSFGKDPLLDKWAEQIRQCSGIAHMQAAGEICPQGFAANFIEALELREAVTGFAHHLMGILDRQGVRFELIPIHDARVRSSRQLLAQVNLRTPFSRQELAQRYQLSPAQLDRLWRQETGTTPARFWNHRRLQNACSQLLDRSIQIKQIAYNVGFDHLPQFSNWFAKHMRSSPSQFRNLHQRD